MTTEPGQTEKAHKFHSLLAPPESQSPDLRLCFVSLLDRRQVDGIDQIRSQLEKMDFSLDHFEYKVTQKTEIRRPINPKLKNSPMERVTVEEKINVNASLKALRPITWRVTKEPENILLVQINRTKGESFALCLLFDSIFEEEKPILVTGATQAVKVQLQAKPDLEFEKIPEEIEKDPVAKEDLMQRASRKKGMQATARELMDLVGLPDEITDKIRALATGRAATLTDAEAVNVILLADLHSRYLAVYNSFVQDVSDKRSTVPNLAAQFQMLTAGIRPSYLVSKLGSYLGEEGKNCKTNSQIFSFLYKKLQELEEGKKQGDEKLSKQHLFGQLKGLVIKARSQFDPELWNKCIFYCNPEDPNTNAAENQKAIEAIAQKTKAVLINHFAANSRNLMEVFLVYNILQYVQKRPVWLDGAKLSPEEKGVVTTVLFNQLNLRPCKKGEEKQGIGIFSGDLSSEELIEPLHAISRAYGYLMYRRLRELCRKFLAPGLRDLSVRFGGNFFEVFYERVITETGFPITRKQFAWWLQERKLLRNPADYGYIESAEETEFDPLLTDKILLGSAESLFPVTMDEAAFYQELKNSKADFLAFFDRLKKHLDSNSLPAEYNPAKVLLDLAARGLYDFRGPVFRNAVKATYLFEELTEIVTNIAVELKSEIESQAVAKKIILYIPLQFSSLLYFGNTFNINAGDLGVQIHLISLPVKKLEEIPHKLSRKFAKLFAQHLKGENPERVGLVQGMRMISEYFKVSHAYFRNFSIIALDRAVFQMLKRDKLSATNEPRHLKYHIPDEVKLIIGSSKETGLGKVCQFEGGSKGPSHAQLSFGQVLQPMMYCNSADVAVVEIRDVINRLLSLMERFADSFKQQPEWKKFESLVQQVQRIMNLELEAMEDSLVKKLVGIGQEMNQLVNQSKVSQGALCRLEEEWKKRNPKAPKKFYFFKRFMSDDVGSKDNLIMELRQASKLLHLLAGKRAVIFFPDMAKKYQMRHLMEIGNFVKKRDPKMNIYIEVRGIGKEDQQELARYFYPENFFKLDTLEPERKG